mmetsp:Transcript_21120/g.52488  ORF Transcript_21120/g.52488 Transcript_21120/m.52488 type:complete len:226 (+) Transcript_21120:365-1042(+)
MLLLLLRLAVGEQRLQLFRLELAHHPRGGGVRHHLRRGVARAQAGLGHQHGAQRQARAALAAAAVHRHLLAGVLRRLRRRREPVRGAGLEDVHQRRGDALGLQDGGVPGGRVALQLLGLEQADGAGDALRGEERRPLLHHGGGHAAGVVVRTAGLHGHPGRLDAEHVGHLVARAAEVERHGVGPGGGDGARLKRAGGGAGSAAARSEVAGEPEEGDGRGGADGEH